MGEVARRWPWWLRWVRRRAYRVAFLLACGLTILAVGLSSLIQTREDLDNALAFAMGMTAEDINMAHFRSPVRAGPMTMRRRFPDPIRVSLASLDADLPGGQVRADVTGRLESAYVALAVGLEAAAEALGVERGDAEDELAPPLAGAVARLDEARRRLATEARALPEEVDVLRTRLRERLAAARARLASAVAALGTRPAPRVLDAVVLDVHAQIDELMGRAVPGTPGYPTLELVLAEVPDGATVERMRLKLRRLADYLPAPLLEIRPEPSPGIWKVRIGPVGDPLRTIALVDFGRVSNFDGRSAVVRPWPEPELPPEPDVDPAAEEALALEEAVRGLRSSVRARRIEALNRVASLTPRPGGEPGLARALEGALAIDGPGRWLRPEEARLLARWAGVENLPALLSYAARYDDEGDGFGRAEVLEAARRLLPAEPVGCASALEGLPPVAVEAMLPVLRELGRAAEPMLLAWLSRGDSPHHRVAALALVDVGGPASREALESLRQDADPLISWRAGQALERLGAGEPGGDPGAKP